MIKIREEYKKRLFKVLKKVHYENLMARIDDDYNFYEYFIDLTGTYLDPDTCEAIDETYELEDLYALISADN